MLCWSAIGFIVAHIHLYGGLNENHVKRIVESYLMSIAYKNKIYSSAEFYSNINYLLIKQKINEFGWATVVRNNLLNPSSWNNDMLFDFPNQNPIDITQFYVDLHAFMMSISENGLSQIVKQITHE